MCIWVESGVPKNIFIDVIDDIDNIGVNNRTMKNLDIINIVPIIIWHIEHHYFPVWSEEVLNFFVLLSPLFLLFSSLLATFDFAHLTSLVGGGEPIFLASFRFFSGCCFPFSSLLHLGSEVEEKMRKYFFTRLILKNTFLHI